MWEPRSCNGFLKKIQSPFLCGVLRWLEPALGFWLAGVSFCFTIFLFGREMVTYSPETLTSLIYQTFCQASLLPKAAQACSDSTQFCTPKALTQSLGVELACELISLLIILWYLS